MKTTVEHRIWARYTIVFAIGFFGLVAQTLLFRNFFTVFEGNELGIAGFFTSWLLWVAVGALLARSQIRFIERISSHFEFLTLLYIPAYVLQAWLISNSRVIAGVETYELFPFARMLPVSLIANAPVSFSTGLLFTIACKWISRTHPLSVARVYIMEAVGSVAGGVFVTLMLVKGLAPETVFLYTALLVAVAVCVYRVSFRAYASGLAPLLIVLVVLVSGVGPFWTRVNNLRMWERLLPEQAFLGDFTTSQTKYLYGEYHDQFNVMAWESVMDSIPNTEYASEVVALHLAQCPAAQRFLVIGPGSFSICKRLLILPQAESITWLDPDPGYPENLLKVLPEKFTTGTGRLNIPGQDPRRYIAKSRGDYDLVILNLPDVTTLALNRYFTKEFFLLIKAHLSESGIVGIRVSAGENYMGDDLVNLGASVYHTLTCVFKHLAIKPGDETWLIASDGAQMSESPGLLLDRFRAIEGANKIYPPEGLLSLYLPDRIGFQLAQYRTAVKADSGGFLLNTDRYPKALFHNLLFVARQAGTTVSLSAFIRTLAFCGMPIVLCAICLYGLLRFIYLVRRRDPRLTSDVNATIQRFDCYFLVFSTGAIGMALNIILMYLYQAAFGSLFLHVGLISALFMFGLTAGSIGSVKLILSRKRVLFYLLPTGILLHLLLFLFLYLLPPGLSQISFAGLFLLAGILSGLYVPAAAALLSSSGLSDKTAGSVIELNDHMGGAFGGLLIGLFLLPVFGFSFALAALALLLVMNLPPLLPTVRAAADAGARDRFESLARPFGYSLFGVASFLLISSFIFSHTRISGTEHLPLPVAKSMASGAKLVGKSAMFKDGRVLNYFVQLNDADEVEAYIFSTKKLAPGISGYAGPLTLALKVDSGGILRDLKIIKSNETEAYMKAVESWHRTLIGRDVFGSDAFGDVDGVTGATLTSSAIIQSIRKAGRVFADEVLGLKVNLPVLPHGGYSHPENALHFPDSRCVCFILLALIALILRRKPSRLARRVFLLVTLLVAGLYLNIQYSMDHVFSLLSFQVPRTGLNISFFLVLVLPLTVVLFGNIYCGYLCPFGALQELIGELRPRWLKVNPDKQVWRYARQVKYLLLFLLTVLFAVTLDRRIASYDPLVTVFAHVRSLATFVIVAVILVLSFFYDRFWCRNLCPAGAFLSLLNGLQWLKRLIPAVVDRLCIFGVTSERELDCICCDRCRSAGSTEVLRVRRVESGPMRRVNNVMFMAFVILFAFLFIQQIVLERHVATAETFTESEETRVAGQPRDVNMKKLQQLINEHRLSGREALYYRSLGESGSGESR